MSRGVKTTSTACLTKRGFRYAHLLIHSADGPVTLTAFKVQEHVYRWTGSAGFTCSDGDLNRLYAAARRTVALNSWDGFIDCPTREQRAWVGDAVVHQIVHLIANADWRLASHFLDLGNSPRPDGILPMSVAGDVEGGGFTIPDWSLHGVHGVHSMYRYQGDKAQIKEYLPTVERILRWYLPYLGPLGVLEDVAEWNLIDWSALYSEGQSSIVTALWARELNEFAQMADWLGEAASAAWARAHWHRLRAGFDLFWDDARWVYVDCAIDGAAQCPVNQIASALAIVSGLAPQDRHARMIAAITDPARLVVRSWMFAGHDATPQERGARFRSMVKGDLFPDWDVAPKLFWPSRSCPMSCMTLWRRRGAPICCLAFCTAGWSF
jgi:alpha-L-rhamnosidase